MLELFVCGINIGLIYLGYVYVEVKDVLEVIILEWNMLLNWFVFFKVLILFLLNNFEEFVVFGYEVDLKYVELVEDEY